jgi:hypothetical protein
MGQISAEVLEIAGVIVHQVDDVNALGREVEMAAQLAFVSNRAVAVLIGQRLIGAKTFE